MSEKKVLETLEKNPAGLSITDVAQQSKLHRNTVSRVINKLKKEGKVEMKKAGSSKLYYSKEYSGLHKTESGYKGENISVGIGVSDLQDGYQAAISATKQAVNQATKGDEPTFSLVFVSSKYNPQIDKVVKGINKILGTENWIGCTTDREINSVLGYCEGTVEVLCIDTKHLYFGVGVSENYRKDPVGEGKKATLEAIEDCPADRSKFATAQFMRGTKKGFSEIVRNPPYFVLTFPGGFCFENYKPVPGMEEEFLEGIRNVVGIYIPIVGAGAAEDVDRAIKNVGDNYVLANGKYYKKGAVVCFIVSELSFGINLEHGYKLTDKYGIITKVSGNGKLIEEINGNPALDEYCKLIGIKKEEFIKNPYNYTFIKPLCSIDSSNNIYPQVVIPLSKNPKEKIITTAVKNIENSSFIIGLYDERKTLESVEKSISKILKNNKDKKIVLALNFDCSVRRMLLREKVRDEISKALNIIKKGTLFGFYTMGEIGSKENLSSRFNNITSTVLCIFDKLQVE